MIFRALVMNMKIVKLMLVLSSVFILASCGSFGQATPQALPTVVLDQGVMTPGADSAASPQVDRAGVTASGIIAPAEEARLAFARAGEVTAVEVGVGDRVEAGQVLARLAGSEDLQAALSTAELEVFTAEQALQKLDDDLPEQQAAALETLNKAREALRKAQQKVAGLGVSSEPIDVQVARSNVALAERALEQARKDFKPYENKPENNFHRAALLSRLSEAQKRYDNAVEQLNRITGVTVPAFDREQAQTELEIAQAKLKLAEDRYALLQTGPDPVEVGLAQARLKSAQDRAAAARASLADLDLKAPIAGIVTFAGIHTGEWVTPGQPVLALADLDHLRIETTDLSERDIPQIEAGQAVTVSIKALNLDVTGKVSAIAPLADTLGGDVVYKTTIDLDEQPAGLRAGMSVEVQFSAGP